MLTEEQLRAIENRAKGVDVWYGGDDCEQVCRRDVPQLLAMVRELQREVDEAELAYRLLWQDASAWRGAIRRHRDARGHDRCWEGDLELYRALGEPLPEGPGLPCREEFLAKCAEYYEQQAKESRDG